MIKKTVKYEDFNGNQQEETHYFHLSKFEMTKIETEYKGGFSNKLKEVAKSGDNGEIFKVFTKLMLDSYGVKSEDGKRFIKDPDVTKAFSQSIAFEEIFVELASNEATAEAFLKGAMKID